MISRLLSQIISKIQEFEGIRVTPTPVLSDLEERVIIYEDKAHHL